MLKAFKLTFINEEIIILKEVIIEFNLHFMNYLN